MEELTLAADDDLCAGRDIGAGRGGLLARRTAPGDLHIEARGRGHFNYLAHRQTDERWDGQLFSVTDGDLCGRGLRCGNCLVYGGRGVGVNMGTR